MRTILTPCIKICKLDPTAEFCIGCGRTKKQIKEWRIYTDDQKKSIIEQLKDKRYGLGANC